MRTGIDITDTASMSVANLREVATMADQLGVEIIYLSDGGNLDAITVAVGLRDVATRVRMAAEVRVTARSSPVHIAERACVADQILEGRLILVLRGDDAGVLHQTAEAVTESTMARPFSLPGSERVNARVTPSPLQPILPIWLRCTTAPETSARLGLSVVGEVSDDAAYLRTVWSSIEKRCGVWARTRLNRPAFRSFQMASDGQLDVAATTSLLVADRSEWGIDVVLFVAPVGGWSNESLVALQTRVRPRLQLGEIPPGIEQFWDETHSPAVNAELPAPYAITWRSE
jgi:hypothetical protein